AWCPHTDTVPANAGLCVLSFRLQCLKIRRKFEATELIDRCFRPIRANVFSRLVSSGGAVSTGFLPNHSNCFANSGLGRHRIAKPRRPFANPTGTAQREAAFLTDRYCQL